MAKCFDDSHWTLVTHGSLYEIMKETIFNLFLYLEDQLITQLGIVCHEFEGADGEKLRFLSANAENDLTDATRFDLPDMFMLTKDGIEHNALHYDTFREMRHNGTDGILFEEIFQHYGVSQAPLMCISPVVDGSLKIKDGQETIKPNPSKYPSKVNEVLQPNFRDEYISEAGFRLTDLINDDFYEAIRLTYNGKLYVSSAKLMMSCIDSIAYLEYGDLQGNFRKWLDEFIDLTSHNINSEELWEFRNSILHMTNLDSRRILNETVTRIQFYVAKEDMDHFTKSDEGKYFNYYRFITTIAEGIEKWGETYNTDKDKLNQLLERYDRVLSDKRKGSKSIK